ncbi:MAG: hypothetical protein AAF414_10355 [Pseudomonadota bacterium]
MADVPGPNTLRQLSFRYLKHEDRLLLCVGTKSQQEFRIWITRRVATLLWPVLMKGLESQVPANATDQTARTAIMAFQQEQAAKHADFTGKYKAQGLEPVVDAPILPLNVRWTLRKNGTATIVFEGKGDEEKNIAMPLTLSPALLYNFCKVFADAVGKVEWGLDFQLPAQEAAEQTPSGQVH